uniref:ELKS/RAB6-interacting/CAST family member 2 n=1 Tax=Hippocampus comes TaxID=109280 RepID=A0A3Q2XAX1_HIPCM
MPLNVRAKPAQCKLSAVSKSSGRADGTASNSRFSRSAKQAKGKQTKTSSTPGCRSGLEPGSVSTPISKVPGGQESMSRLGPKKPGGATHTKETCGSATAPGGKTMSMENIQSFNAVYGTSGIYSCERDALEPSGSYPKGTMTLGRNTSCFSHSGRGAGAGSSPNVNSTDPNHPSNHYGKGRNFRAAGTCSLQRQSGRRSQALDSSDHEVPSASELQAQLRELQRENDSLRKELDGNKDGKTGHSINSAHLWSVDAKRDKGIRREDGARSSALKDHYKEDQDNVQLPLTVEELQEELRAHREMNSRLQQPHQHGTSENFVHLQSEHERQAKELFLLRKTMEEMEMRIDSQKQTLGARDESIQRLLEMLQGQGQGHGQWGRGQRTGILAMAAQEAEGQLENMHVKEVKLHRRNQQADPAKCRALQTVIDMKDTKISSLERNIRDLEDEVQMLKTSGLLHPDDRQDEFKQVEVYKSHSKFMKNKIEQLKRELNRKEPEMQALQTKLETLANQNSDCKQHIEVLKESLNAKEQRANTLQTEVDALRVRLEEKEQFLTKKNKQLQDLTDEKSTLTGEIRDMKDMLDVKERKVKVLQKKIDNLLEQLRDKDKQLSGLRDRVQGLQTDSSNTDTALATLEEALSEKERVIETFREQKERADRVQLEELERLRKDNQELKDKLSTLQPQKLSPSHTASASHDFVFAHPGDSKRLGEATAIFKETNIESGRKEGLPSWFSFNGYIAARLRLLEQEVARYREESGKSQAEVARLMAALKDAEADRSGREKKINDLERQLQRVKNSFAPQLPLSASQEAMHETAERIGQLENALRESMNTSARRDVLWAQEETAHVRAQRQLEELMGTLEKTRQELDTTKLHLSSTQHSLHERDRHLNSLRQERRKQLEEILEMKQQALLAAISEKDANIALLELSPSKRRKAQEEVMALKREKDRLMHQLKQQVQPVLTRPTRLYEECGRHAVIVV